MDWLTIFYINKAISQVFKLIIIYNMLAMPQQNDESNKKLEVKNPTNTASEIEEPPKKSNKKNEFLNASFISKITR